MEWSLQSHVAKALGVHADAVGAPKEYIFPSLLTVSAAFMGINAPTSINDEWSEPAIWWNVVAAGKGKKKTAAMKCSLSAVEVSHIITYNNNITRYAKDQ